MMRVGVFSDTHGILANLSTAMALSGKLDAFVHLGDFSSDAEKISAIFSMPYYSVRGNCDYLSDSPRQQIVQFENASILLMHGDQLRSTTQLSYLAEEQHCAAALFGHTHIPLLTAQGPLIILNPGSLSLPRGGNKPSFAVLTIDGSDVDVKIISIA